MLQPDLVSSRLSIILAIDLTNLYTFLDLLSCESIKWQYLIKKDQLFHPIVGIYIYIQCVYIYI